MITKAREKSSTTLRIGFNGLNLLKLCSSKKNSDIQLTDFKLIPSQQLELKKRRKITLLLQKSSSKGSTMTSISILLKKKTLRGLERDLAKFAQKLTKRVVYSILKKLLNYPRIAKIKNRAIQYLPRSSNWYKDYNLQSQNKKPFRRMSRWWLLLICYMITLR